MVSRNCKSCKEEKALTKEFFEQGKNKINNSIIYYFYKSCRVCRNKYCLIKNRKYKSKNRKKLNELQKIYYRNNKEKDAIYKKLHYQKNKVKYLLSAKNSIFKCRKENFSFRLKCICSSRISTYLKNQGHSKNNKSILKYLPFSMQELREHLEKQFEPWMNWQNYGVYRIDTWDNNDSSTWFWNIDHIIPHSTFKYTSMEDQSFKDCWSLSNLRPLSAKQNLIDGNRK